MKSMAIEREFGSGGRDIGIRIAKEAQIPYYDGQLLIEAAKRYGIEIADLKEFDENKVGSLLLITTADKNCHNIFTGFQNFCRTSSDKNRRTFCIKILNRLFHSIENLINFHHIFILIIACHHRDIIEKTSYFILVKLLKML